MALPRRQWTLSTDYEIVSHLSTANRLSDVAQLSDCLVKMAEHIWTLRADEQHNQLAGLLQTSTSLQQLYTVTGSALQQLANCLQAYLQQGQLPAALPAYAVEACTALCLAMRCVHSYSFQKPVEVQHELCRKCIAAMRTCAAQVGTSAANISCVGGFYS
jgi:hypothetical protein